MARVFPSQVYVSSHRSGERFGEVPILMGFPTMMGQILDRCVRLITGHNFKKTTHLA